jgi:hypothetical protein
MVTPQGREFPEAKKNVILRCEPSSASLEGCGVFSTSFETPRKSAAPQDDGGVDAEALEVT